MKVKSGIQFFAESFVDSLNFYVVVWNETEWLDCRLGRNF